MITPKPLFPGARVALVCASSAVPAERLAPAVEAVSALGLVPVLYPSCTFENRHGYFAETDAQRAKDIQDAFADDTIDGVLSTATHFMLKTYKSGNVLGTLGDERLEVS